MTWCITALIFCLDITHRTSSVDKQHYTRAYLSLKGGFSGVFLVQGFGSSWLWSPSNTLYSYSTNFSFLIFTLLQSLANTCVIMALFLSLVSLFGNNSNNNNSNNNNSLKLIHKIKTTYLMLQNVQFKLSEFKINTELLHTILSEHLI